MTRRAYLTASGPMLHRLGESLPRRHGSPYATTRTLTFTTSPTTT